METKQLQDVASELLDILAECNSIETIAEKLKDAKALAYVLQTGLVGSEGVVPATGTYSLMLKEQADVVIEVIQKFRPTDLGIRIESPREALAWFEYLTQQGYAEKKNEALEHLKMYINENLVG